MPDLYLVWAGVEFGSNAPLFGMRCGTSLPYFEQPQTRLNIDSYASGIALAALPDRILCLFSGSDTANKVLGVGGEDEWLASAICQQWPSWPQVQPGAGLSLQSASM